MASAIVQAVQLRYAHKSARKQKRIVNDVVELAKELQPFPSSITDTDQFRLFKECISQISQLKYRQYRLGAIFHVLTLIEEIAEDFKHLTTQHQVSEISMRQASAVILHANFLAEHIEGVENVSLTLDADSMMQKKGFYKYSDPIFPYYCGRDWADTLVQNTRPLWNVPKDKDIEPVLLFYSFTQMGLFDDPTKFEETSFPDEETTLSNAPPHEPSPVETVTEEETGETKRKTQVEEMLNTLFPESHRK